MPFLLRSVLGAGPKLHRTTAVVIAVHREAADANAAVVPALLVMPFYLAPMPMRRFLMPDFDDLGRFHEPPMVLTVSYSRASRPRSSLGFGMARLQPLFASFISLH